MATTARVVGELGGDPRDLLLGFDGRKLPSYDDAKAAALLHQLRQAQRMLEGSPAPAVRHELNLTQSAGPEFK